MELVCEYVRAVVSLFAESAPYLLVGFFLAGLIRVLVPQRQVYRHFGGNDFKSVTLASLFGIPLPLCSCSVLPTAAALRDHGASKGATTAFIISAPETGLDSIALTWALLDPIMAVMRPVAALVTALVTGSGVNRLVTFLDEKSRRMGWRKRAKESKVDEPEASPVPPEVSPEGETPQRRTLRQVLADATSYAFRHLLDDLTQWFILGFLISGVVVLAIPDGFFGEVVPGGFAASLLMLVIGIPIYICAAAATPLAAAFIAKGLPPGAALVLLLVGPATNITTLLVVSRLLGKRVMVIYLFGVAACALLFGTLVNGLYASQGIDIRATVTGAMESGFSWLEVLAMLVFFVLIWRSVVRTGLLRKWADALRSLRGVLGFDPTGRPARIGAIVLLVLLYLSSCFSVIGPGEVGWVVRFGDVVREIREPGLVVHLPTPIDHVTRLRVCEVRGVELGFERERDFMAPELPEMDVDLATREAQEEYATQFEQRLAEEDDLAVQAQVMTGEESLLRLTLGIQFDVDDAYVYQYRVADPVEIVRVFSESAVRQAVARRSTNYILVGHRDEIERETMQILQEGLDAVDAGVRITAVTFRDLHAPPEVHYAYRDVASALEDKEREIRLAEGFRTETLATARADAYTQIQEAESYRDEEVKVAKGMARAFADRLAAYRDNEDLTRLRMFFEAAEMALANVRTLFLLGADIEVDLWNVNTTVLPRLGR